MTTKKHRRREDGQIDRPAAMVREKKCFQSHDTDQLRLL
jgi:hypothetical protein